MIFLTFSVRGSIRVGSSSALAGLEQGGISEGRVCNPIFLQLPKFLAVFMGWFASKPCFTFFFPSFFKIFLPSPKAKSREPWGNHLFHGWQAGRLADAGRSSTVPLTFFQGLAVPLQGVGCMQAPVYSRIPKSCFVFSCLLLQSVPGSVGDSSSWSFTGLEREGFGFFCLFFLSSPSKH